MHSATTGQDGLSAITFFKGLSEDYGRAMAQLQGKGMLLDAVLQLAYDSFDTNVSAQTAKLPALDCHKGCATCCTLRVTATAPEVLMVARFIRALDPALQARGIDLPGLELVVHADLPGSSETLLHRSGRTGRAGASGTAISLVSPGERHAIERIAKAYKVDIQARAIPTDV